MICPISSYSQLLYVLVPSLERQPTLSLSASLFVKAGGLEAMGPIKKEMGKEQDGKYQEEMPVKCLHILLSFLV